MKRQLALGLADPPRLGVAREDPRVWVEMLRIYERPGVLTRDLSFHRGLNIVWAPDDASRGPARGHGAGKTVLCRLLRFILGESLGDKRISEAVPEGFVAARVHVDGTAWAVVRPMKVVGQDRAGRGGDLERLIAESERGGLEDYRTALRSTLREAASGLPKDVGDPWFAVLEWIARDQGCFEEPLIWRGRANKRWRAGAARTLLRFGAPRATVRPPDAMERLARYEGHQKRLGAARTRLERLEARLEERSGVTALPLDDYDKEQALRARRNQLRLPPERPRELDAKANEFRALADELAALTVRAESERANEKLFGERVDALEQQLEELGEHERDLAVKGIIVCSRCRRRMHEPEDIEAHAKALEKERGQHERDRTKALQSRERAAKRVTDIEALAGQRRKALGTVERDLERLRKAHDKSLIRRGEEAAAVDRKLRDHADIRATRAEVERLEKSAPQKPSTPKRDEVPEVDASQWASFKLALNEIAHQLIGVEASAKPKLTADGIEVPFCEKGDHPASGPGLETLGALAFDLAALRMAIADKADLPGLWIHDSPRETNLGPGRSASLLEALYRLHQEAGHAFQYILTTTDSAPDYLRAGPLDKIHLGSATDADLLLGRRF